jgi:CBS domain-containing protein
LFLLLRSTSIKHTPFLPIDLKIGEKPVIFPVFNRIILGTYYANSISKIIKDQKKGGGEMSRATQLVKVKEIMTRYPVKIVADETIHKASNLMAKTKLGSRMVSKEEVFIGILEEAEIIGC